MPDSQPVSQSASAPINHAAWTNCRPRLIRLLYAVNLLSRAVSIYAPVDSQWHLCSWKSDRFGPPGWLTWRICLRTNQPAIQCIVMGSPLWGRLLPNQWHTTPLPPTADWLTHNIEIKKQVRHVGIAISLTATLVNARASDCPSPFY